MKKIFLLTVLTIGMLACGGASEKQSEEKVTPEEEAEMVESINEDLDDAQNELEAETEESLNEIDSLLQNAE